MGRETENRMSSESTVSTINDMRTTHKDGCHRRRIFPASYPPAVPASFVLRTSERR